MKKLVGGDYLLDLTPIELEESEDGETYTNITNADIIAQLTNLKKFVPNPSMVKPVWVKLKNGETDEVVVARGEFKVVDSGEFEIVIPIDGYKLKIHIEFTQVLNDDSVPMDDWYIDTNDAKYLFTSDAQNVKEIIENEDFGDVELAGDLSVGGDLDVIGNISGGEIVEKMTGYSFTKSTGANWTPIYAGIVKNGNKLTLVVFGNYTFATGDTAYELGKFIIPSAVGQKLYPYTIGSSENVLSQKDLEMYSNTNVGSVGQIVKAEITKSLNTILNINLRRLGNASLVNEETYLFRLEFTFLLNDNLIPESQGE